MSRTFSSKFVGNSYNTEYSAADADIVPSDTVAFPIFSNRFQTALYVGGAGNISALHRSGATIVITGIPAGTILDVGGLTRVNTTSTTATAIAALFEERQ